MIARVYCHGYPIVIVGRTEPRHGHILRSDVRLRAGVYMLHKWSSQDRIPKSYDSSRTWVGSDGCVKKILPR